MWRSSKEYTKYWWYDKHFELKSVIISKNYRRSQVSDSFNRIELWHFYSHISIEKFWNIWYSIERKKNSICNLTTRNKIGSLTFYSYVNLSLRRDKKKMAFFIRYLFQMKSKSNNGSGVLCEFRQWQHKKFRH